MLYEVITESVLGQFVDGELGAELGGGAVVEGEARDVRGAATGIEGVEGDVAQGVHVAGAGEQGAGGAELDIGEGVAAHRDVLSVNAGDRITTYNVCYTKLLRLYSFFQ